MFTACFTSFRTGQFQGNLICDNGRVTVSDIGKWSSVNKNGRSLKVSIGFNFGYLKCLHEIWSEQISR